MKATRSSVTVTCLGYSQSKGVQLSPPLFGIIYKATEHTTGRVYIGQTIKTLARRKTNHAFAAKKGDRRGKFQIAIIEHGINAFCWEQIDTAENQYELDQKEKYWIDFYKSNNPTYGYNLTTGGIVYNPTEETKQKISVSMRGENNHKAVLTEQIVKLIKIDIRNMANNREIARKHNVSYEIVKNIRYRRSWVWITI